LTIRHVTGHRIVALVEVVSPSNKDRSKHVDDFVSKATAALTQGIHLTVIDLLPPGPHDPDGMYGAVWRALDDAEEPVTRPADAPLALAAFVADSPVEVYLQHTAVAEALPEIPLFLSADVYINLPLEPTYAMAFRGLPEYWRGVLEAAG
jgi:hypothetical protein